MAGLLGICAVVAAADGHDAARAQLGQGVFVEAARAEFRADVERLAKTPGEIAPAVVFTDNRYQFVHRRPSGLVVDRLARSIDRLAHAREEQPAARSLDGERETHRGRA